MSKIWTLLVVFCFIATASFGQRYTSEIFSDVSTSQGIYGENITVLTVAVTGQVSKQPLQYEFYEPTGDTETERPLVILLHTGNFLPNPTNGGTGGTMRDSFIVETASRLAKMGYVACVADYRTGWNPLAQTQPERAKGLIQAAYRGIQDVRTAVRFFKKDYSENSNSFGIDTSKITVFGQGTGGYISLGAATIDNYQQLVLPKFIDANSVPMIITSVHGDIYGTSYGSFGQDTLCLPNHVGYSSEFQLCVNVGGALGDTSWLTAGDPAMISFQTTTDPFAPYAEDILTVPTTGDLIVEVQGSYTVQAKANALGNNDVMKSAGYSDVYTDRANMINDGLEGLFPFDTPTWTGATGNVEESSPWEWWDATYWSTQPHNSCPAGAPLSACNSHIINSINNPNMSKAKAMSHIDSIIGYFTPRACAVLDLPCSTVSDKEVQLTDVQLVVAPNPASNRVRFTAEAGKNITDIHLYDIQGRLVSVYHSINNTQYDLQRDGLATGLYVAKVYFEEGVVSKKIMFD
ncbi:MAG: T9SS type A sorting domain-containing protein [Saprospiraceae bacterium]